MRVFYAFLVKDYYFDMYYKHPYNLYKMLEEIYHFRDYKKIDSYRFQNKTQLKFAKIGKILEMLGDIFVIGEFVPVVGGDCLDCSGDQSSSRNFRSMRFLISPLNFRGSRSLSFLISHSSWAVL